MLLGATYDPGRAAPTRPDGDVVTARRNYEAGPSTNLRALLEHRYEWLREWIDPSWQGVELAAGMAVSRDFLDCPGLLVTDVGEGAWLDVGGVDALATPFEDGRFDFVLIQNAVHHLSRPLDLFDEAHRILRPGGRLFIRDVVCSLALRAATRATRVEGWNFAVDVYDRAVPVCDPDDPWASNNAVPDLLFDDLEAFHAHVRSFRVVHQHLDEFLLFALSGGVTHKTFTVPLSRSALRAVTRLDNTLTRRFPRVFAMQRSLVLERQQ